MIFLTIFIFLMKVVSKFSYNNLFTNVLSVLINRTQYGHLTKFDLSHS